MCAMGRNETVKPFASRRSVLIPLNVHITKTWYSRSRSPLAPSGSIFRPKRGILVPAPLPSTWRCEHRNEVLLYPVPSRSTGDVSPESWCSCIRSSLASCGDFNAKLCNPCIRFCLAPCGDLSAETRYPCIRSALDPSGDLKAEAW